MSDLVLRAKTLIDGTGAPPVGPVDVVVEGNRIVQIKSVGYPGMAIKPENRSPANGGREIDLESPVAVHADAGIDLGFEERGFGPEPGSHRDVVEGLEVPPRRRGAALGGGLSGFGSHLQEIAGEGLEGGDGTAAPEPEHDEVGEGRLQRVLVVPLDHRAEGLDAGVGDGASVAVGDAGDQGHGPGIPEPLLAGAPERLLVASGEGLELGAQSFTGRTLAPALDRLGRARFLRIAGHHKAWRPCWAEVFPGLRATAR